MNSIPSVLTPSDCIYVQDRSTELCVFNLFFLSLLFRQAKSLFVPSAPPDFCQQCQYTPHQPSSRCQGLDRAPAQAKHTYTKSHSVLLRKVGPSSDLSA